MEVKEYEVLLKHLYRDAPIGLCFFDTNLRYQHINECLASLNGLSVEDHLGRTLTEVIPDVSKGVESILRRVMKTGEPVLDGIVEAETRASSHQKRIFQHSYQAVTSDDGVTLGVSCIVQDITERTRADESLRKSESRFRTLFENSEVSIWNEDMSEVHMALKQFRLEGVTDLRQYLRENPQTVWDLAALVRVINVNKATLKLFGAKDKDQLIYQIDKTFGPNAIEVFAEALIAIWDGKRTFRAEADYRTLDDRDITAIISFQIPETAEGFNSVPVSILDITERKWAENSLKEMNVALAHAMPGIARLDLDGRYVEVNDIYADITGYRPDEMIGMDWTRTVHPDDHADAFRAYERMLHEDTVELEALGVRKDATTFFKHVLLVKTTDEQGNATGHHCFMRDISERKLAENAMIAQAETERLLRRELNHRVRNNLASLISLIDLSRSGVDSIEAFAESIKGRTQTIASVHAALSGNKWQAIDLHTLLHTLLVTELEGRFRLDGPEVIIPMEQAQALGLVAHELATNSRKHGALCKPGGSVAVNWELNLHENDGRQLLIHWQETGGPPIEVEPEPGTGIGLIRGLVKSELQGQIDIGFPRNGADHTITLTLTDDSKAQYGAMADSNRVEIKPLENMRVTDSG